MTSQKPMRLLEGAPELVERDVLAAQDAVDVEAADLHATDAVLLEGFPQLFRVHVGREPTILFEGSAGHAGLPSSSPCGTTQGPYGARRT